MSHRRPARTLACTFAAVLALSPLLATAQAACSVSSLAIDDPTRSTGLPYASPSERGNADLRLHALLWSPAVPAAAKMASIRFRDLLASAPGPAGDQIAAALRFHGLQPETTTITSALDGTHACPKQAPAVMPARGRSTQRMPGVLVTGALPPVFYAGLAEALAQRGIAAAVLQTSSETDARLLLHRLIDQQGWNAQRIGLVGHGYGAKVAHLLAMQWSGARALVSLDGFEALDPAVHPAGSSELKPGHLRLPILHWQASDRPHAHAGFYDRALRSDYVLARVPGLQASPWATTPELAMPPAALQPLLPALPAPAHARITQLTTDFLETALAGNAAFDFDALNTHAGDFSLRHRAALPAPALRMDGIADEAIWSRASALPAAPGVAAKVAEDCYYLYVLLDAGDVRGFTTELYLAPRNGGTSWTADDLLLHTSNSLCWNTGSPQMTRDRCTSSEAWWGGSRTARATDPPRAEYFVAKSKLGLAHCAPATGLRLAARIAPGPVEARRMLPQAATAESPQGWHVLGGN